MNPVIEQIYSSGFVEDEAGKRYPHKTASISYEAGMALYHYARDAKPQRTIEIGMAYGLSTLFICQALHENDLETRQTNPNGAAPAASHSAIDPFERQVFKSIGLSNLRRADLDNFLRFFEMPSAEILPDLIRQKECFDFALIDGSHLFDYALVDFFLIDQLLKPGGCVAFDDLWMPAVRKVVSYVMKNRAYRLIRTPYQETVPVWKRTLRTTRRVIRNVGRDWALNSLPQNIVFLEKTAPDERPWDFHHSF